MATPAAPIRNGTILTSGAATPPFQGGEFPVPTPEVKVRRGTASSAVAQTSNLQSRALAGVGYTEKIGTFEATMPKPEGGTGRSSGKYLVVWKRQNDGN